MDGQLAKRPKTLYYGLALTLISLISVLLEVLSYPRQLFILLFQFACSLALFIYPVLTYKRQPRLYFLPLKIYWINLIFLLLLIWFLYTITGRGYNQSSNDSFVGLIDKMASNLPRSISTTIKFAMGYSISLISATIIALVVKQPSNKL